MTLGLGCRERGPPSPRVRIPTIVTTCVAIDGWSASGCDTIRTGPLARHVFCSTIWPCRTPLGDLCNLAVRALGVEFGEAKFALGSRIGVCFVWLVAAHLEKMS
jgi:hypothetical protein